MKFICTSLIVLLSAFGAFAQTTAGVVAADTTENSKISILSVGASYGNTPNYYGQTTAVKLGYVSADLSYQSKTGLWGAVSSVKLLDIDQPVSEVDVAVGYDLDITKRLGARGSYTRYFFAKDSPLPQSINPNKASIDLSYDFKLLQTSLSGDYVFGGVKDDSGRKINDFYLNFFVSKSLDLGSIIKGKDYIEFKPSLGFIAGTQRIGAYETKQVGTTPRKGKLGLPLPGRETPVYETTYVESSAFSLIASGLNLPLSYNRAHYTIEGTYQLSIPNKNFEGIVHENQSFFTLSFTYLFYKDK